MEIDKGELMLNALNTFFVDDIKLAEQAGYTFDFATDDKGEDVFVQLVPNYDLLPEINITPKKRFDNSWIFPIKVTFPEIDLDTTNEKLESLLDSWKDAALLADEIESIKFVPEDWIEL